MTRAVSVTVSGRVQGVGFRYHVAAEAQRLGVVGWVRNEPDETVAGHFEGDDAAVEALVAWCRGGPTYAAVQHVAVLEATPTGSTRFEIRY